MPPPSPADYFRAAITDPKAAEVLAGDWDPDHQTALRSVAAQQAILAAYPERLDRAGVRSLTRRMRKVTGEPIDSYAVATIIDSFFDPESDAVVRRIESIPLERLRRMTFLLPYGIFTGAITPLPATDIEKWIDAATTHFERAMEYLPKQFGSDYGKFYSNVCTSPAKAYIDLTARTDISDLRKRAMIYTAAFVALRRMYGDTSPTPTQRDQLIAEMRPPDDDSFDAAIAHLIHIAYSDDPHWPDDDEHLPIALLLPKTMADLRDYNLVDIAKYMQTCVETEAEAGPNAD